MNQMADIVGGLLRKWPPIPYENHDSTTSDEEESFDQKIVGYFGSWILCSRIPGHFEMSDFEPSLCTHMIYCFVQVNEDGSLQVSDPWVDLPNGLDGYRKFTRLRRQSPDTKFMIAIGGWGNGSAKFSAVASTRATRAQFAENVVDFLKKYRFDGCDIDWEFPNQRGGDPADRENFVALLKKLRRKFEPHDYVLSVAVAAAKSSASKSYNIEEMAEQVDFINLMTYDFNGSWNSHTGLNAPISDVKSAVRYWINQGAPRDKLVLGIPAYGTSFTLANPDEDGIGAPTTGPGEPGPYTQEAGILAYNEIRSKIEEDDWTVICEEGQGRIAVNDDQWVGYDGRPEVKEKAKYIKEMGLGGAMLWRVDTDDFRGEHSSRSYPLLKILNKVLK